MKVFLTVTCILSLVWLAQGHTCYSKLNPGKFFSQGKIEIDPLEFEEQPIVLSKEFVTLVSGERWSEPLISVEYKGFPCSFSSLLEFVDFLEEVPTELGTIQRPCPRDAAYSPYSVTFYKNFRVEVVPWYPMRVEELEYEKVHDVWFVVEPLTGTSCFVFGIQNLKEFLAPFPYFSLPLSLTPEQMGEFIHLE